MSSSGINIASVPLNNNVSREKNTDIAEVNFGTRQLKIS
jgi:hypothetical protein